MRLAFDARTLNAPKTGDRTVTLGLLRGLLTLPAAERPEVYALGREAVPADLGLAPEGLREHQLPVPGGYLWMPLAFPRGLRQVHADCAVVQYMGPWTSPCPWVTFIHDTVWRTLPETFPVRDRLLLDAFLPGTIARAAAVCTGSQFAAEEIIRHFPHAAGKVAVIPYGVDEQYRPVTDPVKLTQVRARYALPERFILSVGVLQPRKNVAGLMAAYHQLPVDLRDRYDLVITGKQGWLMGHLPHLAAEAGPRVHFTGYVADEDLPALYTLADAFAYPSLYEGYGLPPLEAMACGTPVLTSRAASLPEVVGEGALLVDPLDAGAIAEGLRALLTDAPLRQALIAAGRARASQLTWTLAARRLLEVWGRVQGGTKPPPGNVI